MEMTHFKKSRLLLVCLIAVLLICSLSIYFTYAAPQGATIGTPAPSVDSGPTINPQSRNDTGGQIVTLSLSLEQQNFGWKAYVGNVTGSYVLKNSYNYSIYEWSLGTAIAGEVYMSRNSSVNWSTGAVTCASQAEMIAEQALFGMLNNAPDNINNTFNSTFHNAFDAGTNHLAVCPTVALWVNDTAQMQNGSNALFQEVVLHDEHTVVYASVITNDKTGFDNRSTFDFQAIVPENRTSSVGTPYYFYVELGN